MIIEITLKVFNNPTDLSYEDVKISGGGEIDSRHKYPKFKLINVYSKVQNGQKMTRKMCQKSSNVDPIYSLSFFHYFREFKYSRVVPQNMKSINYVS